jgi:hypothetical protein
VSVESSSHPLGLSIYIFLVYFFANINYKINSGRKLFQVIKNPSSCNLIPLYWLNTQGPSARGRKNSGTPTPTQMIDLSQAGGQQLVKGTVDERPWNTLREILPQ